MQPRPLSPRKTVQLFVALTILAWATQTLFHQWGYGGIIFPSAPEPQPLSEAQLGGASETPATQPSQASDDAISNLTRDITLNSTPATQPAIEPKLLDEPSAATTAVLDAALAPPATPTVELRVEATTDSSEVTLKQLCRWNDESAMSKYADLVVARLSPTNPVRQIALPEIKAALHDAGANLSQLQFAGSASCAVRRSEVDDATFARLLSEDAISTEEATASVLNPTTQPLVADAKQTPLYDLLMTDLSERLKLPLEMLDVHFDVHGQSDLILTAPRCRFDIDSQRITKLGPVSWDIVIHSPNGERSVTILATAKAWQEQLVLTRPLSKGQKVLANDVTKKKSLVDSVDGPELAHDASQIVGQVLTTDLKKGEILYLQSVEAENLVLKDQFVTVAFPHEGLMLETVARALESGSRGQVVRVRNEATNQIYNIIVTDKAAGEVRVPEEKIASTPRE